MSTTNSLRIQPRQPEYERQACVRRSAAKLTQYLLNGAVHRVAADATAWSSRDATWSMVIAGIDPDPGKAPDLKRWGRRYWEAVHPFNLEGGYVNFMMQDEGASRVQATYGANYERLARVKSHYDPGNLFRVNQNILPAAS